MTPEETARRQRLRDALIDDGDAQESVILDVLLTVMRKAKDEGYEVNAVIWGAARTVQLLRGDTP